MKISIITVCLNAEKTIEDTLKSVVGQRNINIEYIVVDGGSKDTTLDILDRYKDNIDVLITGKDKGIYHAMNKGIRKASGDVIGILNADDFYVDEHVLKKVVDCFTMGKIQAVYGDICYIDREHHEKVVRRWKAGEFRLHKLKNGWIPPHPTFFVRKQVYEKYGLFRVDFSIASDYEFMLRVIGKHHITIQYIEEQLVNMRSGGHSATSTLQRMRGWKELQRAWHVNDMKSSPLMWLRRIISKINQYVV